MITPKFVLSPIRAALLILIGLGSASAAQAPEKPPAPPPELRELMRLLDKPAVRAWIEANTPVESARPHPCVRLPAPKAR